MLLRASDYTLWNWLKSVQLGRCSHHVQFESSHFRSLIQQSFMHSLNESIIPFNPFTAPDCKISRLKDAQAYLKTVYFLVL